MKSTIRGFIVGLMLATVVVVGQERRHETLAEGTFDGIYINAPSDGPPTSAALHINQEQAKAIDKTVPAVRAPISVSANEALELKDTYTNALLADAQWQNRLLRAKVDHGVPADYVYDMQKSRFEAPAPTPTPKEQPKP